MTLQRSTQAHPLAVPPEELGPFMPDMEPEDYAPPEFRLVQSTSRSHYDGGAPLGSYFCDLTGEVAESLDLVILSIQRNRTLWKQGDLNFPICSSDDRITPRPGGAYKGPCAQCVMCNKGCYTGYNLLCIRLNPEDKEEEVNPDSIFLLRVGGTSVFPFRKLWSKLKMQHASVHWSVAIRLPSDERANDKGPPYWTMRPDIKYEFEPGGETWKAVLQLAMDAVGIRRAASQTDTEAIAAHADTQGPQIIEQAERHASTWAKAIENPHPGTRRTISAPQAPKAPQAPQSGLVRPITQLEANQTTNLAKRLNADPKLISAFIVNTFGKNRLSELHTGELAMLTKWIEQEFSTVDDLPF